MVDYFEMIYFPPTLIRKGQHFAWGHKMNDKCDASMDIRVIRSYCSIQRKEAVDGRIAAYTP